MKVDSNYNKFTINFPIALINKIIEAIRNGFKKAITHLLGEKNPQKAYVIEIKDDLLESLNGLTRRIFDSHQRKIDKNSEIIQILAAPPTHSNLWSKELKARIRFIIQDLKQFNKEMKEKNLGPEFQFSDTFLLHIQQIPDLPYKELCIDIDFLLNPYRRS